MTRKTVKCFFLDVHCSISIIIFLLLHIYMEQNFKDIEQRRISCMFGDFIRFCSR